MKKVRIGLVVAMCGLSSSAALSALKSETDGFGRIRWGERPSRVEGLVHDPAASEALEESMRQRYGAAPSGAMQSFSRSRDTTEFGGVVLTKVSYQFYRGRFASATLHYVDTTKTEEGLAHYKAQSGVETAPQGYGSHKRMEAVLKDMFGEPTEGASGLIKFSRGVGGRFAYRGEATIIVAECSGAGRMNCSVTFSSKEIEAQAESEFSSLASKRSASLQESKQ
jgi:hypothetical protein